MDIYIPHQNHINIVISQSMYFPWVGLLEQIRLADIFVHYDDVQFSKGSFCNRVQIKTVKGRNWLTVPLKNIHLGQKIEDIEIDEKRDWRSQHREILRQAYLKSPFREEMLSLIDRVYTKSISTLADVSRASLIELADYFNLINNKNILSSKSLSIDGTSSQRILDIVLFLKGKTYITGHGARNYLDHQLFERSGISVQYMKYQCIPYPQLHGDFTPYVTALDLVANCGRDGVHVIKSTAIDWREFINESN